MAKLQDSTIENLIIFGSAFGGGINPIGTIIAYAGKKTPPNWLFCDGSTFSRNDYPELYDILESETLPDLAGTYSTHNILQGATVPNQKRNAGLPNITGKLTTVGDNYDPLFGENTWLDNSALHDKDSKGGWGFSRQQNFNASKSNDIYGYRNETTHFNGVQPDTYTVRYLIRAK